MNGLARREKAVSGSDGAFVFERTLSPPRMPRASEVRGAPPFVSALPIRPNCLGRRCERLPVAADRRSGRTGDRLAHRLCLRRCDHKCTGRLRAWCGVRRHRTLVYGVGLSLRRRQSSTLQFRDVAWENILQLAEPGEWPLDVGISFEVERSQASQDQINVTGGALLQKEFGLVQANFNILLNHVIEGTGPVTTRLHFQGQLKYRYSEPFEFGIQAFSNVGSYRTTWAPYSDQVHRIGPVALGKFKFARERSLSYNAAFLFGTTDRSPDRTLRFQIEYEF